ncbi:MAG: phosphohydrolase [Candidatus Omnitrophica bacterium]|nr:phosphohydrolase [Candidatus Omnitrophota bacterium]
MIFNCPGSQRFKQPWPESVNCKYCGEEVEIWTDEFQAICPKCKKPVTRSGGQSCMDWCKEVKECVGREIYNKYLKSKGKKGGE